MPDESAELIQVKDDFDEFFDAEYLSSSNFTDAMPQNEHKEPQEEVIEVSQIQDNNEHQDNYFDDEFIENFIEENQTVNNVSFIHFDMLQLI